MSAARSSIRSLRRKITSPVLGSFTSSAATRPRMRSESEATISPSRDRGAGGDRAVGAAVVHLDDAVLRHVDQPPGEVARVRGLQRGVGQALAGAVGRVEVLEHGQAFLEVRHDRGLDDLARGLGHQAAHAAELLHLRRRAAGAGVAHHVDRVRLELLAVRRPYAAPRSRPSSRRRRRRSTCDQASTTLLYFSPWVIRPSMYCCSNSFTWSRVRVDDRPLGVGDDHVVLAEGDAGAGTPR